MIKYKRNETKKRVGIPDEQIKYDPVKVKERLDKIKKKRTVINNSLTAVPFVLLVAAVVLLVLFLLKGDTVQIDKDRILGNLQSLCYRNSVIIATHSKANLLLMWKIAFSTFFTFVIPKFLYFGTGIEELISRAGTNIFPEQSVKQLWSCVVANGLAFIMGCKQLISAMQVNLSLILHGFQKIFVEIGEKKQQIQI